MYRINITGRVTGASSRVTKSARPDMCGGSVATVAHIEKTHLTRARNRSVATGAVRPETYDGVSIRLRCHSRSTKPNWTTGTDGKRQQPGFR